MLRLGLFIILELLSAVTYAQQIDTLAALQQSDSVLNGLSHQAMAAQGQYNKRIDSLQSLGSISRFKDSLKISGWSDSLRRRVEGRFSSKEISRKLDSLRGMNLSTDHIAHFSDSLVQRKVVLMSEIGEKQMVLQKKVTSRYDVWMSNMRSKFNLDSAGIRLPGASPNSIIGPSPKLDLPVISGDQQPSNLSLGFAEIPSLSSDDFEAVSLSPDLKQVAGELAVPSSEQLGSWGKDLTAIPGPMTEVNGRLGEVKALKEDPSALAEKAAGQVSEISDASKALTEVDQTKSKNELMNAAGQAKDAQSIVESSQKGATDHFAGKEEALQAAMTKMSEYKRKYSSVGSLSEIKKESWLPRNGLKGQPFKQRIRVGVHTGFKGKGDTLLLDFYPNASYRIAGRLEAGLGAIYRVRLNTKDYSFDQRNPVWGMSTFAVVKTFKSLFLRFEVDGNSYPKHGSPDQSTNRDWRWTFHSGIQSNFKLGSQWTGIIQMLYSFDANLKDGFPEKLVMRAGVQYRFIK